MPLVLLFHYLLLNMFRMLLVHPSSGPCNVLWIYFMCCIALVRCVLVLRCGSAGVVWYRYAGFSLHKVKHICYHPSVLYATPIIPPLLNSITYPVRHTELA